jgi:hypothetical protein
MKRIANVVASFLIVLSVQVLALSSMQVGAVGISDVKNDSCTKSGGRVGSDGKCEGGSNISAIFKTIANILLFLVGAIAVIMLIIGGLRYVTSNGDQNAVTGAKNTIMYAIIGIVVAFLAYAAVNFVTAQLSAGVDG